MQFSRGEGVVHVHHSYCPRNFKILHSKPKPFSVLLRNMMHNLKLSKMIGLKQQINLKLEVKKGIMQVNYARRTSRTIYDICDAFGRILISGNMSDSSTKIDIDGLPPSSYIFLILDGDRAISRRFTVAA